MGERVGKKKKKLFLINKVKHIFTERIIKNDVCASPQGGVHTERSIQT